jgi:hypothetical protein
MAAAIPQPSVAAVVAASTTNWAPSVKVCLRTNCRRCLSFGDVAAGIDRSVEIG